MSTVPRRPRPGPEDRAQTILTQTRGAHSGQGSSAAARPVTATRLNRQHNPPIGSSADMARLGVLYRLATTGLASSDKVYVPSWTVTEEAAGGTTLIADSSGIGIYGKGIYAVHLFVHGEGMQSAAADCAVIGFCDYTDPFFESFGAVTRGGDPSSGMLFPSTSRTYYHPGTGSGALQPGLAWVNLDTVNVTRLDLEVQVQQLA